MVAKRLGLPCGYVALTTDSTLDQRTEGVECLYLARFRVHPLLRRLGIGRALINSAVACAEEDGFHELFAEALRSNLYLQDVYRSLGFERIAEFTEARGSAVAWSLWRLKLS